MVGLRTPALALARIVAGDPAVSRRCSPPTQLGADGRTIAGNRGRCGRGERYGASNAARCRKMQQMRGERFREREGGKKSCDNNSERNSMLGMGIGRKTAKRLARGSENQA